MSWKHGNPGCGCCGCTFTDEWVCVCPCQPAISTPRRLYIGDSNGTHTLDWTLGGGTEWPSALISGTSNAWTKNPISGVCTDLGSLFKYQYILRINYPGCPGGGPPGGIWRLVMIWYAANCSGTYHYANGPVGTYINEGGNTDIPFTCDLSSGLAFTVPTTGPTSGLSTPGGGGSLLVLP